MCDCHQIYGIFQTWARRGSYKGATPLQALIGSSSGQLACETLTDKILTSGQHVWPIVLSREQFMHLDGSNVQGLQVDFFEQEQPNSGRGVSLPTGVNERLQPGRVHPIARGKRAKKRTQVGRGPTRKKEMLKLSVFGGVHDASTTDVRGARGTIECCLGNLAKACAAEVEATVAQIANQRGMFRLDGL